ncbi:MAG: helix-turn-helix transcriptional regulator [Acidimicrobiales bacterium]
MPSTTALNEMFVSLGEDSWSESARTTTVGCQMTGTRRQGLNSTDLYYTNHMVSGDLIKEARLRAGLTQSELGARLGKAQSVIARWERDDASPSLETLRGVVRACGFDLTFFMSKFDDSNVTIIDQHLRMTPAERFTDLMTRVRFHEQREQRTARHHG